MYLTDTNVMVRALHYYHSSTVFMYGELKLSFFQIVSATRRHGFVVRFQPVTGILSIVFNVLEA